MITDKIKAQVMAKIIHDQPLETIAQDFNLPIKLITEWKDGLEGKDLMQLKANVVGIASVLEGEIVPEQEDILKDKLEKAACEIANQVPGVAASGDMLSAKALQLLANGVSTLYATLILKSGLIDGNARRGSIAAPKAFHELMKD